MRIFLCFVAVMALLAGCGSKAPPPVAQAANTSSGLAGGARPVDVTFPSFGDARPHDWSGRAPGSYAVHGIDVSRYQPPIDWRAARRAGVSFAFIKATEGVEELDPRFAEHWAGAGRAGIPRAAYHFYYFCAPADEQARWFIRNVPRRAGSLPHVLDMEWNPFSPTCRIRPDGADVRRRAQIFLDILEAHYGQRPIVYTTIDFWRETGIGRLPRTRFWLRSVAGHPSERYPGAGWDFWQYTGTGLVPGVQGEVDINVFHGPEPAWANYGR